MRVTIQGTYRISCVLSDLWRCLVGRTLLDCQVVLVTFADGSQRVLTKEQTTESALLFDRQFNDKLVSWQLLMLPIGTGPEADTGGLMDLVRERDHIREKLAGMPSRQHTKVEALRRELATIEARLDSLPATVFEDFRVVASTQARVESLESAVKKYADRANWTPPVDEMVGEKIGRWEWAGDGSQCERIDEPWGFADDALEGI